MSTKTDWKLESRSSGQNAYVESLSRRGVLDRFEQRSADEMSGKHSTTVTFAELKQRAEVVLRTSRPTSAS